MVSIFKLIFSLFNDNFAWCDVTATFQTFWKSQNDGSLLDQWVSSAGDLCRQTHVKFHRSAIESGVTDNHPFPCKCYIDCKKGVSKH